MSQMVKMTLKDKILNETDGTHLFVSVIHLWILGYIIH